ncbi:MAG: translation initiation factor IF-3 [Clostridia bacterium]|nr:translation initiation factor IF-3 [Clostridia bacterium]MBR4745145.1 translation initiation factor IF-3 [Clostridia bacterium]
MKELIINENIKAREVRLIGADGAQLGIVSLTEALAKAEEEDLDLALISPTANPPVCKIMNYGKYRFDEAKREKEAKKKQKVVEVKEMRLSMNIAENDIAFKAKNVRKFLEQGNKVKVSLRMYGRQMQNPQLGMPTMQKFYEILSDICDMTSKPEVNGRQIIMVLSPKNEK